MTVNEFKAWLEGFCEGMDSGYPTVGQWEKVLEKVGALADTKPADMPSPVYREWPHTGPQRTWLDNQTVPAPQIIARHAPDPLAARMVDPFSDQRS